jgi:hypothetical protein
MDIQEDMARAKTIANTKELHSTNVNILKQWAKDVLKREGPALDRTALKDISQSAQAIEDYLRSKYTNLNSLKTHFATLGKLENS